MIMATIMIMTMIIDCEGDFREEAPVAKVDKPWESGLGRTPEGRRKSWAPSFFVRLGYLLLSVAKVAKPWESGRGRTLAVRRKSWAPSFFVRLGYFSLLRSQGC